jgi:hypothetical protein
VVYQRRASFVEAWKLPQWGEVAEEVMPPWLVSRMQTGEVFINTCGGMSVQTPFGVLACNPGDHVILTERHTIEFCQASDFSKSYTLIDVRQAA